MDVFHAASGADDFSLVVERQAGDVRRTGAMARIKNTRTVMNRAIDGD